MRRGEVLFSAVQLMLALFFLFGGAFFLLLPSAAAIRFYLASILLERGPLFYVIGAATFGVGLLLLIAFYFLNQRQYYQVKMDAHVELPLIREYVERYWDLLLPQKEVVESLTLSSDRLLEITINLQSVAFEKHADLLSRAERELSALLARHLGYQRELLFTVLTHK